MINRYRAILRGEKNPYYLEALEKDVGGPLYDKSYPQLWELHDDILKKDVPSIQLKLEIANRMMERCTMCEWRCGVDRKRGDIGRCGVSDESKVSSMFLHPGEERVLVPSHTIFFSRCNFSCVFCQNWDISQRGGGRYIRPLSLAGRLDCGGGKNVNWVGGDPTPNLAYIIEVISHMTAPLPQIWNSNMYLSKEGMKLLAKLMDVYLTDFKYGNDDCAEMLSGVQNYTDIVKRNHLFAEKTGDLIIRHLVLPDHLECCTKPLLRWIDENLKDPAVNVMTQYRPSYQADQHPDINRYLSREELRMISKLKNDYSHLIL